MLAAGVMALAWIGQSGGASTLPVPVFTQVRQGMFPSSWTSRDISASGSSLPDQEVARSMAALDRAMEKYPRSLLQKNLKRVYVLGRLAFYGVPYGGTNSSDTVYLANGGRDFGFSDRFLEESFHHEFSSILLRNHPGGFDRNAWMAANPPGFKYLGDGTQAVLKGKAGTKTSRKWQMDGFLAEYATASIEEDFNMVAESLLTGSPEFWAAVDLSPRLKKKADVAMRFYGSLSSSFTASSFRAFSEIHLHETKKEAQ